MRTLQVFGSFWRKELVRNGLLDVLGVIEGDAVLRLDNTQVEIFIFCRLLRSYIKIALQVRDQAGVGAVVQISAQKIIS